MDKLSDDIGLLKSRIESEVRIVCYGIGSVGEKVQFPDSKDNSVYNFLKNLHFFLKKEKLFIYLSAPGLNYGMWDLVLTKD